jgi:DnaJ-class molecular chaperone
MFLGNHAKMGVLKDIEVTIECSLIEFYLGSERTIKYERREAHHNPKAPQTFSRTKQI